MPHRQLRRQHYRILILALVLASFGPLATAQEDPDLSFSVGGYLNTGYGTNGWSAVPGVNLVVNQFPINLHLGTGNGILELAGSVDWLPFDFPLGTSGFSGFVGPGAYGGWAIRLGDKPMSAYGYGVRGVFGVRTSILGLFEPYFALTPACGSTFFNAQQTWVWNADFEIGLRIAIAKKPIKQAVPVVVESPPAVAHTPPAAAEVPIPEVPAPEAPIPVGLTVDPTQEFAILPDEGGSGYNLALPIKITGNQAIATWNLSVTDPAGLPFKQIAGEGSLPNPVPWDGVGDSGDRILSEKNYTVTLQVTDAAGNTAAIKGILPVGILLVKEGDGYKLDLSGLVFVPNEV